MRYITILFFFFATPFILANVQAQSFDYEERPTFNFKFMEAQIDLQVNPDEGTVNGSVIYNVQANMNNADTLILDAPGIQVDSIQSAGEPVNFTQVDNLKIVLSDSSEMGQQFQFEIFYRATPQFGLLKSSEGTMWTSLLPRSNSHWLPVKDHPRVEMVTTLSMEIPAQYTAFASGVRTDREVLSTSRKKVTFRTGRPIPITALTFGFGQFREEGTSAGIKRINSYAERGSVSSSKQQDLVNQSKRLLGEIEQATGMTYPYQRLNIVISNDHYWEQKPYGASTIFLYKNRGNLTNQLRRGLYAQWFGVFQHEEQWATSWPVQLLQTALHYSLSDSAMLLNPDQAEPRTSSTTVYNQFSAEAWNHWQQSEFSKSGNGQFSGPLIQKVLQQSASIITPDMFKNMWYDISGQPAIAMSNFISPQRSTERSDSSNKIRYRVDYIESQSSLQMKFQAQEGSLQQPVTLPVTIMTGSGDDHTEITVSGASDSVSVSIPAGTRAVYLDAPEDRSIALEEHKPVPYLLYQLRNAATTEAQKKAALQLGYHTDNPDLQLALNDLMSQEDMAPEVEAALLRSYGKITAGAEGTQKRFLDALKSDNLAIQTAALDVLGNYNDQSVTDRLRSMAQDENNSKLSNRALHMYLQQVDSTTALQFTNTLVQQDTSGARAILAIEALGSQGNAEQAVKLAGYYIEPVYSYEVRKKAFQILLAHDTSGESWNKRVSMLMNDFDPRIRFLTVQHVSQIPGVNAAEVISSRKGSEYDARVIGVMN